MNEDGIEYQILKASRDMEVSEICDGKSQEFVEGFNQGMYFSVKYYVALVLLQRDEIERKRKELEKNCT